MMDPLELPDAWVNRAACKDLPAWGKEIFFPDDSGPSNTREAKAICAGCEVRAECLDFALRTHEDYGVWGGMSAAERQRLRRTKVDVRTVRCRGCRIEFSFVWEARPGYHQPSYCNDVCKQADRRRKRAEWRAGKRLQKGVQ